MCFLTDKIWLKFGIGYEIYHEQRVNGNGSFVSINMGIYDAISFMKSLLEEDKEK